MYYAMFSGFTLVNNGLVLLFQLIFQGKVLEIPEIFVSAQTLNLSKVSASLQIKMQNTYFFMASKNIDSHHVCHVIMYS